jgi:hypothetical protein
MAHTESMGTGETPPSTTAISEPLVDDALNDPTLPRVPGTTATSPPPQADTP